MYSKVIQIYIYIHTHIYVCVYIYIYIYTHTHTHTLYQILFPYRLLQNTEYSSLCCTVGPCWLSSLYVVVCICIR